MPCGTWKTLARRNGFSPSTPAPSVPIGTRDMLSTPPPTATCCMPESTPVAAKFTACKPEPQKRLSVTAVTSCGQSAASTALRAMLAPCSCACVTQPMTTSSTSRLSTPVALRQLVERLRQQLLRVNAAERALARFAASARCAHRVQNIGLGHLDPFPRLSSSEVSRPRTALGPPGIATPLYYAPRPAPPPWRATTLAAFYTLRPPACRSTLPCSIYDDHNKLARQPSREPPEIHRRGRKGRGGRRGLTTEHTENTEREESNERGVR